MVILTDTILSSEKSRGSDFKALCDQHHPFIFPYLHHLISNALITPSKEFLFSNHASWAILTMGWLRMIFMARKVNFDPISWGIYELNENTELFKLFNEDCSPEASTSKKNKNRVEKTITKNKTRTRKGSKASRKNISACYDEGTSITANNFTVIIYEKNATKQTSRTKIRH